MSSHLPVVKIETFGSVEGTSTGNLPRRQIVVHNNKGHAFGAFGNSEEGLKDAMRSAEKRGLHVGICESTSLHDSIIGVLLAEANYKKVDIPKFDSKNPDHTSGLSKGAIKAFEKNPKSWNNHWIQQHKKRTWVDKKEQQVDSDQGVPMAKHPHVLQDPGAVSADNSEQSSGDIANRNKVTAGDARAAVAKHARGFTGYHRNILGYLANIGEITADHSHEQIAAKINNFSDQDAKKLLSKQDYADYQSDRAKEKLKLPSSISAAKSKKPLKEAVASLIDQTINQLK